MADDLDLDLDIKKSRAAGERIIGHITLRFPIHAYTEQESWEIPEKYTVLESGDAELVEHDLPAGWHDPMREMLTESGITSGAWTDEHIAAACTRPVDAARTTTTDSIAALTK